MNAVTREPEGSLMPSPADNFVGQPDMQPLAARTLGDIAASLPGATVVFRRHKLDFWCGGSQSLEQAARRTGLDPARIEAELAQLPADERCIPESNADLIDHILSRYHQVHRREIAALRELAGVVERVHSRHPAPPAGLASHLERMQAALVSHMLKEEQILFPFMRAGGGPMIVHPIAMMRHEHDGHDEELKALAALTGDMKPPGDACDSWRALYAGLVKLAEDLTEHIHIENNILFPRFEG
jgi:regulator of cell morphogenesis and NO signaling